MPVASAKSADDLSDEQEDIRQDTEADENESWGSGKQELQVTEQ